MYNSCRSGTGNARCTTASPCNSTQLTSLETQQFWFFFMFSCTIVWTRMNWVFLCILHWGMFSLTDVVPTLLDYSICASSNSEQVSKKGNVSPSSFLMSSKYRRSLTLYNCRAILTILFSFVGSFLLQRNWYGPTIFHSWKYFNQQINIQILWLSRL